MKFADFDSHDNMTKHYNTQRLLYKYLYALIVSALIITTGMFYAGYVYVQVNKINQTNTLIVQEYLTKGRISTLDKINQKYAKYCYSTQLANFIKDVYANKEYNADHRYRLLFLLRKGQGSLIQSYQTLSIQEKKVIAELIYSKATDDSASETLPESIARELELNHRLILAEIGSEKANDYDWSKI